LKDPEASPRFEKSFENPEVSLRFKKSLKNSEAIAYEFYVPSMMSLSPRFPGAVSFRRVKKPKTPNLRIKWSSMSVVCCSLSKVLSSEMDPAESRLIP
jgi:hypothetical protein